MFLILLFYQTITNYFIFSSEFNYRIKIANPHRYEVKYSALSTNRQFEG